MLQDTIILCHWFYPYLVLDVGVGGWSYKLLCSFHMLLLIYLIYVNFLQLLLLATSYKNVCWIHDRTQVQFLNCCELLAIGPMKTLGKQ